MNKEEIRVTPIWSLYEKGQNYHRMTGIYVDSDRNYRFYNGNQWEGAQLGGIEPVQINFIKPIVKYKLSVIHSNLYAVVYNSQNYRDRSFRQDALRYCEMLTGYAARIWERDKMDKKGRAVTKDAAINDEGIIYVNFNRENMTVKNEVINKSDIYYGDENNEDIQSQPYILIRKRLAESNAVELALSLGMSAELQDLIIGDNDNFEESGDAAKKELDPKVTVIYKMYKKDKTVHYSVATRFVTIAEDIDLGISLYPVAHMVWEEKKGSARGEGEVRSHIPNQIEVNKTAMRRVLTVKNQAYPHTIIDETKVSNPDALNTVGGTIKTKGATVDDVRKVVGTLPPAQMSGDVKQLEDDLINITRDLAGAGDSATGQINPETASGRAILAVQQVLQAPMTEQKESFKFFVEDLANIWLEYLIAYSSDGIDLEEKITDPRTGEDATVIVTVPQSVLKRLQATVKIDVTPKGVYDRFAQEQTLENLLTGGFFKVERIPETRAWAESLPDDSVAPKQKILEICDKVEEQQRKIAMIESEAQMMAERAQRFIMSDPDGQAAQISDARAQLESEALTANQIT